MIKTFALKLHALFIPLAVVYGPLLFFLVVSGELSTVPKVIERQNLQTRLVLYGPAYSDATAYYKIQSILARSPRIITLGTSRVMQFRSRFFKDPGSFFNAGGGIGEIGNLKQFLDEIPKGKEPQVIILGLDQCFFNPNWGEGKALLLNEQNWFTILAANRRTIYDDFFAGKFNLGNLLERHSDGDECIGLNAMVNRNGFRNDGSYHYGKFIADPSNPRNDDYGFRDTMTRIIKGTNRFEYGDHVSAKSVFELDAFLRTCNERGIYVAGFFPPFAHAVYDKMAAMRDKYRYLSEASPCVTSIFRKHGFCFFDFSDLSSIGASDDETIDGFHGSEKAYLRLFLKMQEKDMQLHEVAADEAYLRNRLHDAKGPFEVFGNSEL